jgi:hypothetical protein
MEASIASLKNSIDNMQECVIINVLVSGDFTAGVILVLLLNLIFVLDQSLPSPFFLLSAGFQNASNSTPTHKSLCSDQHLHQV